MGLVLIAAGAILLWAVNWHTTAVNIHTVGAILLVVGLILGLFEAFFYTRLWGTRRTSRDFDDRPL
jgi:uncharacterized membrane protein